MSSQRASNGVLGVERLVARVLLLGGALGVTVALVGLILYAIAAGVHGDSVDLERVLAHRAQGQPPAAFLSVWEVVRGVARRPIDPLAVMELGMLALVGTPVVGVALAIPAFLTAGDRRYAVIAAIVLTTLVVGFLVAGGVT